MNGRMKGEPAGVAGTEVEWSGTNQWPIRSVENSPKNTYTKGKGAWI